MTTLDTMEAAADFCGNCAVVCGALCALTYGALFASASYSGQYYGDASAA